MTTMSFSPALAGSPTDLSYSDGRVRGDLSVSGDGRTLLIHDWLSEHPGHGHTVEALTWLRAKYQIIEAHGVGAIDDDPDAPGVGDIATSYWAHMIDKGLVDAAYLDDGSKLDVDALSLASASQRM